MNEDILQKMASVAPRHYAFLVKTAGEIKINPFKDEILEEMDVLVKKAMNWGALSGGLKSGAGMAGKGALALGGAVGTAVAGGIAISLAGDLYDAAKRGITKGRDYKSMMQANPQLGEMPAKEVQKAFSVLHKFNPEFAGDPTVSGAWVSRQVQMTSMNPDMYGDPSALKGLIDARKGITDTRKITPFKPDKDKKTPPNVSRVDFENAMGGLHDRFTGMERNSPWPVGGG